jgi:hypothetical protein
VLANTLTVTYNAVAVTLTKVTEANYTSQYFGENSGMRFTLDVKHHIPPVGKGDESHLVKLSVEHFDANGVYIRTVSPWVSIKTFDQVQDSTASLRATKALIGLMTDAFITQILGRES